MTDSTNPRVMADNIRELSNSQAAQGEMLEAEIGALQIYDDAETDTGKKWINDSSIYRKVIVIDGPFDSQSITANHNITDLDLVITLYGVGVSANNQFPINYYGSSAYNVNFTVSSTALSGSIGSTSYSLITKIYVVLEYTKTPPTL